VKLADGQFGHDLENLLGQAEKLQLRNLVRLADRQRDEIVRASTYYREKVLEYPSLIEATRAYPGMPDANLLIDAADALISALRKPCLAA
jgi:hypothetical protein